MSDSSNKIIEILNFFDINFEINESDFLTLACICRKNVVFLDKSDANWLPTFVFKKYASAGKVFNLILIYRKQFLVTQELSQLM